MNGINNVVSLLFSSLLNASSDSGSRDFDSLGGFENLFSILLSEADVFQSNNSFASTPLRDAGSSASASASSASDSGEDAPSSSSSASSSSQSDKLVVDYSQAYSQQLNVQRTGNNPNDVRMYAQTQQEAVARTLDVIDKLLENPGNLDSEKVSKLEKLRNWWNNTIHPAQISIQNAGNPYDRVVGQMQQEQSFLGQAFKVLNGEDKQGLRDVNGNVVADVINRVTGDKSS